MWCQNSFWKSFMRQLNCIESYGLPLTNVLHFEICFEVFLVCFQIFNFKIFNYRAFYLILQKITLKLLAWIPLVLIYFITSMYFQPIYLTQRTISTSALTEHRHIWLKSWTSCMQLYFAVSAHLAQINFHFCPRSLGR